MQRPAVGSISKASIRRGPFVLQLSALLVACLLQAAAADGSGQLRSSRSPHGRSDGFMETSARDRDLKRGYAREFADRCTSIGVGPKAMADGSTVTTHNNDCQECDIRLTHVPARDWPAGSKRPIYAVRNAYPRYVETREENIHGPDYLIENVDMSIYNWTVSKPIMYIDQVAHTYAYTLGAYALQNEKQVSMGESTCSSKFVAAPIYAGGRAAMHMETLSEIALERCDSARCAVQLMGDLAVQHGFYGPEWDDEPEFAQDEAGEAMTVSDPRETWMFHVMPDDSGSSAIWVAQRVPDDHITAVANQFVIQEIDLANKRDFMASANVEEVAIRNHFWSRKEGKLNFANVYGNDRHSTAFACTRRVWRVFTLAAPSLLPTFSGYTNGLASFGFGKNLSQPYPFSVKPDKPLTVQDIMNMNRDQYEGSDFDLTKGTDAGPFGDPMRYAPASKVHDPVEGLTAEEFNSGLGFHRPISLWRTAYSSITQSRAGLPDAVGAVTWIAQYAPHHASFLPIYASASATPSSLNTGTQYKLDKGSNYWIHCLTGNYLSRWYIHTIEEVKAFQRRQEAFVFAKQADAEALAVRLLAAGSTRSALSALGSFHELMGRTVREAWWEFFFSVAGTYRDMYIVDMPHKESFADSFRYLSVPRWWFEQIGYWGAPGTPPPDDPKGRRPIHPINVPSTDSQAELKAKYPQGMSYAYPWAPTGGSGAAVAALGGVTGVAALAGLLGAVAGATALWLYQKTQRPAAYLPIN